MRRRVVCPRSHPASPYLRRPSGAFASARSFPRGGRPPGTPGWDAYPVGRQLRPWCVGPLAAPWSLGLMVCPDTSVGAAVCTFKQRCARLEGTHSPPEILTRAPTSGPETRPPRCRRVHRQPSRELPAAVRPAGHWHRTLPPCRRDPRAGRAVGYLAEEFCPRSGNPPDDLIPDHRRALCFRKARFAAMARPLLGTLLPAEPAPGCL